MKQSKKYKSSKSVILLLICLTSTTTGLLHGDRFQSKREDPTTRFLQRDTPSRQEFLSNRNIEGARMTEHDMILGNPYDMRSFRTGSIDGMNLFRYNRIDENNNLYRQKRSTNEENQFRYRTRDQKQTTPTRKQPEDIIRTLLSSSKMNVRTQERDVKTRQFSRTYDNQDVLIKNYARRGLSREIRTLTPEDRRTFQLEAERQEFFRNTIRDYTRRNLSVGDRRGLLSDTEKQDSSRFAIREISGAFAEENRRALSSNSGRRESVRHFERDSSESRRNLQRHAERQTSSRLTLRNTIKQASILEDRRDLQRNFEKRESFRNVILDATKNALCTHQRRSLQGDIESQETFRTATRDSTERVPDLEDRVAYRDSSNKLSIDNRKSNIRITARRDIPRDTLERSFLREDRRDLQRETERRESTRDVNGDFIENDLSSVDRRDFQRDIKTRESARNAFRVFTQEDVSRNDRINHQRDREGRKSSRITNRGRIEQVGELQRDINRRESFRDEKKDSTERNRSRDRRHLLHDTERNSVSARREVSREDRNSLQRETERTSTIIVDSRLTNRDTLRQVFPKADRRSSALTNIRELSRVSRHQNLLLGNNIERQNRVDRASRIRDLSRSDSTRQERDNLSIVSTSRGQRYDGHLSNIFRLINFRTKRNSPAVEDFRGQRDNSRSQSDALRRNQGDEFRASIRRKSRNNRNTERQEMQSDRETFQKDSLRRESENNESARGPSKRREFSRQQRSNYMGTRRYLASSMERRDIAKPFDSDNNNLQERLHRTDSTRLISRSRSLENERDSKYLPDFTIAENMKNAKKYINENYQERLDLRTSPKLDIFLIRNDDRRLSRAVIRESTSSRNYFAGPEMNDYSANSKSAWIALANTAKIILSIYLIGQIFMDQSSKKAKLRFHNVISPLGLIKEKIQ